MKHIHVTNKSVEDRKDYEPLAKQAKAIKNGIKTNTKTKSSSIASITIQSYTKSP